MLRRGPWHAARCGADGSATGDEGDHDVGGVAVEVLSPPVVDGGGAWIGVAGGDLDVAECDAGVKAAMIERRTHMWVNVAEPGSFSYRLDPTVGGAPVQSLAVASSKNWTFASFTCGEVDRA